MIKSGFLKYMVITLVLAMLGLIFLARLLTPITETTEKSALLPSWLQTLFVRKEPVNEGGKVIKQITEEEIETLKKGFAEIFRKHQESGATVVELENKYSDFQAYYPDVINAEPDSEAAEMFAVFVSFGEDFSGFSSLRDNFDKRFIDLKKKFTGFIQDPDKGQISEIEAEFKLFRRQFSDFEKKLQSLCVPAEKLREFIARNQLVHDGSKIADEPVLALGGHHPVKTAENCFFTIHTFTSKQRARTLAMQLSQESGLGLQVLEDGSQWSVQLKYVDDKDLLEKYDKLKKIYPFRLPPHNLAAE